MSLLRLGLFASGTGTNLQAILDSCVDGTIKATPAVVIGNNSGAMALDRARRASIPTVHLSSKTHPEPADLDEAIETTLRSHGVELIALAGYNKRLGPRTVSAFRNRILNVHPAPLPAYGGPGLYGLHVHEVVLEAGEVQSAATVHLVDEEYDHGPVVAERPVRITPDDTPESLQARIRAVEHELFVETIGKIADGEIDLDEIAARAG